MSPTSDLVRSPDWDALVALLDQVGQHRGLLTKSGAPIYTQLGQACGMRYTIFTAWRRHEQRPTRATLKKIAAYAGQPLGLWLAAAGRDATV